MKRRPVCLVCLILMLCMWVLDLAGILHIRENPLPESVQHYITEHSDAVIRGEVQHCQATETSFSVYLKHVFLILDSEQIPIKNVKVFLESDKKLKTGMSVEAAGRLEEVSEARNPGEFDSRQYYACQKIYYFMKKAEIRARSRTYSHYSQFMQDMKDHMMQILEKAAGDDAGIFEAMLLGDKANLEETVRLRYQMAGIIHILAISGLHISVVGIGLFDLMKKAGAGNIPAGLLSLTVLLQYGILTGESTSAMRAVCMFLLAIGARIAGRTYDLLTALSVSAVILLLDSPVHLYSSSFWLSFGAVAGLGIVAPALTARVDHEKVLRRSILSSLAVQLTTLPVMLRIYGEVSLAGIFLNLLVLPTVGVVLTCGIAATIVGFFSTGISEVVILPGRILLWIYEKICVVITRIPFCTWIGGSPKLWQCVGYYLLLGLGIMLIWKKGEEHRKRRFGKRKMPEDVFGRKCRTAEAAAIVLILAGVGILGYRNTGRLQITCLDIGQGDCISIKLPKGQNFLIDGGSSNKSKIARYQILPYLKNQGIGVVDAILISHTDNDHISGVLELLDDMSEHLTSVRVNNLILPQWGQSDDVYQQLVDKAQAAGVNVQKGRKGERLQVGETMFRFFSPEKGATGMDTNEEGMVVELEYGGFKGLFVGDIGAEMEKKLLPELEDIDFLKVGHHGSRYSTCQEFLDVVRPEMAVISCSATNRYGHPAKETVERLENAGAKIWYTMKNGAVTVTTDGEKVWADTFIH